MERCSAERRPDALTPTSAPRFGGTRKRELVLVLQSRNLRSGPVMPAMMPFAAFVLGSSLITVADGVPTLKVEQIGRASCRERV